MLLGGDSTADFPTQSHGSQQQRYQLVERLEGRSQVWVYQEANAQQLQRSTVDRPDRDEKFIRALYAATPPPTSISSRSIMALSKTEPNLDNSFASSNDNPIVASLPFSARIFSAL